MGTSRTYLHTAITHVELNEGAQLHWVRQQEEAADSSYFAEVQSQLAKNALLNLTQISSGAGWARSSLKVDIAGEGADAQINGLSFGRVRQHVDQRVRVNHLAPRTTSAQLFKGILRDQARGILNGKIYIARDAQKVVSSQLNHNLIIGNEAEADTKPELEIYADDVKANHGASVGSLDDEKLFYLTSRAISLSDARVLLANAFAGDVVMKIGSVPLRDLTQDRINRIFAGVSRNGERVSLDQEIRSLFPQLDRQVRGQRLVYLDSGATTLKPLSVIEAVRKNMSTETANVHRGAHLLSDEATEKYENVRERVAQFIGADSRSEIVFTRGDHRRRKPARANSWPRGFK